VDVSVEGLVETSNHLDLGRDHALPSSSFAGDIHCVTTWSKLGVNFTGVSVRHPARSSGGRSQRGPMSLPFATPPAPPLPHPLHTPLTSSSTTSPGESLGRLGVRGEALAVEHGGPARLLVPHLYFWKSAKWVAGLRLLDHDQPGFWERNGYHNHGDPGSNNATRVTDRAPVGFVNPIGAPPANATASLAPAQRSARRDDRRQLARSSWRV